MFSWYLLKGDLLIIFFSLTTYCRLSFHLAIAAYTIRLTQCLLLREGVNKKKNLLVRWHVTLALTPLPPLGDIKSTFFLPVFIHYIMWVVLFKTPTKIYKLDQSQTKSPTLSHTLDLKNFRLFSIKIIFKSCRSWAHLQTSTRTWDFGFKMPSWDLSARCQTWVL